jgi:hypothetical protein
VLGPILRCENADPEVRDRKREAKLKYKDNPKFRQRLKDIWKDPQVAQVGPKAYGGPGQIPRCANDALPRSVGPN